MGAQQTLKTPIGLAGRDDHMTAFCNATTLSRAGRTLQLLVAQQGQGYTKRGLMDGTGVDDLDFCFDLHFFLSFHDILASGNGHRSHGTLEKRDLPSRAGEGMGNCIEHM